MKHLRSTVPWIFALIVVSGCATTKITARQSDIGNEKLARPDHIYVYDFAATPADIAGDPAAAAQYAAPATPQTPKEIEAGHKLGAQVATELVADIQGMGLPAERATAQTAPSVGDILIKGYFASVEEGSMGKRLVLGFGSGAADLKTDVVVYQMTGQGLRRLGSGAVDAGGGKTPGVLLPIAVTVATANPIGLLVGGAVKVSGEVTGRDTIEGSAKRTAQEISDQLEGGFKKQGWI
jgi:hypothetical protein